MREVERLKLAGKLPTIEELFRVVLAVRGKYSYRIRRAQQERREAMGQAGQKVLFQ